MTLIEWRALTLGMLATLAGVGLARFAFSALLPGLILNAWFSDHQALLLGAANLAGYLVGALLAAALASKLGRIRVMKAAFLTILLSFLFCSSPSLPAPFIPWIAAFEWFLGWRFLAGLAGALLMVLGPSLALSGIAPERKALGGALVFTGIGLGALASGLLIPLLENQDFTYSWLVIAGVTLVAALVFFLLAPIDSLPPVKSSSIQPTSSLVVLLVLAAYAFDAIGFIPHTLFWVDYLAREAGLGQTTAGLHWAVFGVGAVCGPFLAGIFASRFGLHQSLLFAYAAKALFVFLPLISHVNLLLLLSSFVVGALVPGIVALTSGRIAELVGSQQHPIFWGRATAAFALLQAIAAYGMSYLYQLTASHQASFALAGSALLLALLLLILPIQRHHTTT